MIAIPYVERGEKGTISLSSLEIYYIVDHLESTMRSTALSEPFRLFSNAKTFRADDNPSLRPNDREVLPELQELRYSGSVDTGDLHH